MTKKTYMYELKTGERPEMIVQWCRQNFGPRGIGWDFSYSFGRRTVQVEIRDERFIVMWELCQA